MPSRRRSASTSPRRVHAAACRTIRSFSAAVKDRRLPRLRLDFNGDATRAGRSVGRRRGGGRVNRSEVGRLGHGSGPFSALCTQITRRRLSHSTLAQRDR